MSKNVEFNSTSAELFFKQGYTIIVKNKESTITSGNINTNPEIINLFKKKEFTFFVPISRTHKFLKYLAGQVFIGYYCFFIFGLISLLFMSLIPFINYKGLIVIFPISTITTISSFICLKIAKKAQKRISKSLLKRSKRI